jgi:cytochrome c-type biogenesis protein CcmE
METDMKASNLVAKHARTYNKAHVFKDRKKASKRGYRKHKGRM